MEYLKVRHENCRTHHYIYIYIYIYIYLYIYIFQFMNTSFALTLIHGYLVRESYRFITNSGEQVNRNRVDDVWHRYIPVKVSLLVWRLLRNRLPTKDNLMRQSILHVNDSVCATGCGITEIATHLSLDCEMSYGLWLHVWNWVGLSVVPPGQIHDHFTQFSFMAGMPRGAHLFFKVILFASVWVIWKERNNRIFNNTVTTPLALIEKVKLYSFLWLKTKQTSFNYCYHDWWKHPLHCMSFY